MSANYWAVAMASVAWTVALRVQAGAGVDFPTALSAVRKEFSSRWAREVGRNTSEVLEQIEEVYGGVVAALKADPEVLRPSVSDDPYQMLYCDSTRCRVNTFENGQGSKRGECPGCGALGEVLG